MSQILVVDDNEHIRTVVRRILEREGHTVIETVDSKKVPDMVKKHHFDLMITDILMPGKEGISTISELRKEYPDLKIIAISGGGSYEPLGYLDMAKRVGANRTIPKPFNRQELLDVVNDVLV